MGRRSADEISQIKGLIKKIVLEEGVDSPSIVLRILNERYNINIAKQTLLKMCSEAKSLKNEPSVVEVGWNDLTPPSVDSPIITEESALEYEDNPEIIKINQRIKVLEKDFKDAVSVNERCKLSGQLDSAQKSKLDMKKTLREADLLKRSSTIAKYIVKFGEPTVIKIDDDKKLVFKTDEKQKAKDGDEES